MFERITTPDICVTVADSCGDVTCCATPICLLEFFPPGADLFLQSNLLLFLSPSLPPKCRPEHRWVLASGKRQSPHSRRPWTDSR